MATYPIDPPVTGPGWFLPEINTEQGTARLIPCDPPPRSPATGDPLVDIHSDGGKFRLRESDTITSVQTSP